jgi:hypothetical protein
MALNQQSRFSRGHLTDRDSVPIAEFKLSGKNARLRLGNVLESRPVDYQIGTVESHEKMTPSISMASRSLRRRVVGFFRQWETAMNQKLIDAVKRAMAAYPLYSQEDVPDKLVVMKLFNPYGAGTWFLIEYNPDKEIAFCFVTGLVEDEWGYTSIRELAELTIPRTTAPLIEVDLGFKPTPFSKLKL